MAISAEDLIAQMQDSDDEMGEKDMAPSPKRRARRHKRKKASIQHDEGGEEDDAASISKKESPSPSPGLKKAKPFRKRRKKSTKTDEATEAILADLGF